MLRRSLAVGLAAGALVAVGCHHHCHKCTKDRVPYLGDPTPGDRIPPPDVPTTPGVFPERRDSFRIDPEVGPSPGSWVPPSRQISPRLETPTAPRSSESLFGDAAPRGAPPVIDVPNERKSYLGDPIAPEKSESAKPSDVPRAMESRPGVPAAIPGLPGYATVPGHEGVATGRKPTLDGFDALKANGFRTVVYLHAPGADVAPARQLAEQRGLKFVPIAVSPGTLRQAFEEFTVSLSPKPVYVADEDGTRAGVLWYLHFRTQDLLGDDAARLRAKPLGLTDAGTEEQKQFWIAVQDFLAKR